MATVSEESDDERERPNPWLAVGLSIGVYALTLVICLILVALPLAYLWLRGRPHWVMTAGCFAAAFTIGKAAWPLNVPFVAPGVAIDLQAHPALAALVREIAEQTRQPVPGALFLNGEVNAFVAQRGGFLGLFGRRYLGLGIPLLQALDRAELRAVLAHEFGHYSGGDTRAGAWVYRARRSVARTLAALDERDSSVLRKPFDWYGRTFMRISYAISRGQEYAADRVAARTAGTTATISALRKVRAAGELFAHYWHTRGRPAFSAGLAPPLFESFAAARLPLLDGEAGRRRLLEVTDDEEPTDPLDTHPKMSDRIAALERAPFVEASGRQDDTARAVELLRLDSALLSQVLQHEAKTAQPLRAAGWSEALRAAYVPRWRAQCAHYASIVRGKTLGEVVENGSVLQALARKFVSREHDEEVDDDQEIEEPLRFACHPLRNLVMVCGCEAGYEPVFDETLARGLRKDGAVIEIDALFAPEDGSPLATATRLGLAGLPLALVPTLADLLEEEPTEGSPGVDEHYATLLRGCQKNRTDSRPATRMLVRRFYELKEPPWLSSAEAETRPKIEESLAQQRIALKGQRVRWGRVYMANTLMFSPGKDDCPGCVLYSPDPWFNDRPGVLRAIQANIGALIDGEIALETKAATLLKARLGTEDFAPGTYEVPPELCYGRTVYARSMLLHRHVLMGGFLLFPWFPVVLAEADDRTICIQPCVEWSSRLTDQWSDAVDDYVARVTA